MGVLIRRDSSVTADPPSSRANAPPCPCAINVTTHDATDNARNGTFSRRMKDEG